ncbi:MAG TPA: serine--tRNA ligase [Candidatus Limnocylindrales bacterium]|nr:serine--tRNA ligase [Candidatus Limnocylindrales bacterium]
MLDIRILREQADFARERLALVGCSRDEVDHVIDLDRRRRDLIMTVENMRAERKSASKKIGSMKPGAEMEAAKTEVRSLGDRLASSEKELADAEAEFGRRMLELPNLPHPAVPAGPDDSHNRVVRTEEPTRVFDFEPRTHWDLGETLDIIDFERGVKISGTRFYVLKGDGARLQRALITFMLDLHTREHGYTEIYPPAMVREECLFGTGNLPKFGDNLYRDAEDDFYFVPTAEVPVTNLYRDEILDGAALPIRHVAYTPCFRREKMSAGRDVRGIKRGHQFDKVELVKFVNPEGSEAELDSLLAAAEEVCRRLGLQHRIVEMCTGDLSFVAARKFDIEIWAPGCKEWLEVSSCSLFTDFQARRANIRFRDSDGKVRLVHTLNGSGLALPRVMIGVIETYQRGDGSIEIPPALRPYLGGQSVIRGVA